ncbi:heme-dependent oxidative N-demethylase family protein [Calothrix sp. NIES-3974]|uniref:heme-dependent oxidative N-demethylase family protein n=1 Tax=Calothrix sp. NIES-3974 TaxID=2005462 RepID=UPI000B5E5825|nr:DUF3445 domain-containing protein [Calothrix sp. NIES-3974]BAZ05776.1 hypothetical protein NIES3974_24300 [Calothrix sp. NIES-3974]
METSSIPSINTQTCNSHCEINPKTYALLRQSAPTADSIPHTPRYFPLHQGRYEVKPGMYRFGYDFGNGDGDRHLFQIDASFDFYHQTKLTARRENLYKYFQTCNYADNINREVIKLIVSRLLSEYPQYFHREDLPTGDFALHCLLTQETLNFDQQGFLKTVSPANPIPKYTYGLDAIACQIQEDVTVICRHPDTGQNWVSAIHLCFPNHWSAAAKIGQDFTTIHQPVAEIAPINRRADSLVKGMIYGQPMVRFAWGISTDTYLNHHPEPAPGFDAQFWSGRRFCLDQPQLYLRIERQVIWGLPQVHAALFTIRTYFRDCAVICQDIHLRNQLISAIKSMSQESLIYKGLSVSKGDICRWMEGF